MGCSHRHSLVEAQQIVPGYYQCFGLVVRPVPRTTPSGILEVHPGLTPCGETFHDASAGPVATCDCGEFAIASCACGNLLGAECLNKRVSQQCSVCAERELKRQEQIRVQNAAVRDRTVAALAEISDPVDRLLRAAAYLHGPPLHADPDEFHSILRRICPFLDFQPRMDIARPGPVPWDSIQVGRWFARRARESGIEPDSQLLQGRLVRRRTPAWELWAGSNVAATGAPATVYVLPDGDVVRMVRLKTVHRVHKGNPVLDRVALEVAQSELNFSALARLAKLLKLR